MVLFSDQLCEGEHTYSYVARATTAGTFEHPPAEAEMMYRPETRGHTATGTLVVGRLQGGLRSGLCWSSLLIHFWLIREDYRSAFRFFEKNYIFVV